MLTRRQAPAAHRPRVRIQYVQTPTQCEQVQSVLNHKEVISWLGGFTMLDTIKACAVTPKSGKVSAWLATERETGQPLGALLCAGRPMAFRAKYGSVGVVPEWRRSRISTALYYCMTLQQILEGRRLWEDSIVGDNELQHHALPTYGLKKVGALRHRTGSGKDLVLYDFSLLEDGAFDKMRQRASTGKAEFAFHLLSNYYSDETRQANVEAYKKQQPKFLDTLAQLDAYIKSAPDIVVIRDDQHPTKSRHTTKTASLF